MTIDTAPPPSLPNPPPQYSLTSTMFEASILSQLASGSRVRATLCVEPCRNSLPFCQYAIALRVSIGWWPVDCTTNVSSTTTAALLKPASRSPYAHSSGAAPIGSAPSGTEAKSCAVHFKVWSLGRGGRPQALDRIDDERQWLETDVDPLDRFGGRQFVDRGDGENRLALIEWLVGQRALGAAQVR